MKQIRNFSVSHGSLVILIFLITFYMACKVQLKNEKRVVLEGYYISGWECSAFYLSDQDKVYKPYWLSFHPDFPQNDSLLDQIHYHSNYLGIYLQVEGILKSGGGYGHLGVAEKEIIVTRILRFDPENTLNDFLKKNNLNDVPDIRRNKRNYDSVFLLVNDHMFVGKCKSEIAMKYGIKIEQSWIPRDISPQIYWDSINRHNREVQNRYGEWLNVGWESTIKSEIENCLYSTCDSDSIRKYNKYRRLLMVPGSDTLLPPIVCLLDNNILHVLNENPFIHIQIDSRSLPGEENFSLLRAEKVKAYLISQGIRPARLSIKDFRSDSPIHTNPMDDSNCCIMFTIIQY